MCGMEEERRERGMGRKVIKGREMPVCNSISNLINPVSQPMALMAPFLFMDPFAGSPESHSMALANSLPSAS